jgi:hypothetical protein
LDQGPTPQIARQTLSLEAYGELNQAMSRLPYWARSTNPIVRRHLGMYWRTLPPESRPLVQAFLGWVAVMAVMVLLPGLETLMSPVLIASLLAFPLVMGFYGYALVQISLGASRAMQEEQRNHTLDLLLTTPMSVDQILLGKAAAAIWRRQDDLTLLMAVVAYFLGAGMAWVTYSAYFPLSEYRLLLPVLVVIGLAVALVRLVLDALLVGAVSVLVGQAVPYRTTAMTTAVAVNAFYFLFLFLARYIPDVQANPWAIVALDFVVPIVVPLVLIFASLRLAGALITRD